MISLSFTKYTTPALIVISLVLSAKATFAAHSIVRRSDVVPGPSSQPQPASNQTVNGQVAQNSTSDDCTPYPLDQSTWNRFHSDDYLRTYPNGANLTTQVCYFISISQSTNTAPVEIPRISIIVPVDPCLRGFQ
jgi:hypothetical protein